MDVQSDRCNFFPVSTKVYPYSEEGQDTRRANFWKLLSNKQFIKVKAPDNDDEVFLYLFVMLSICILLQVCGIKLENPRKSLLLWHFSKIKNYDTNRITLKKKTLKLRLLGLIFKHCDIIALPSFLKCFWIDVKL